ncbi:hypothetical protein CYMTET_31027 [Cymbomonas tetramitiformis]|uniref:SAP domain-containing protein n=1 Tax=Cymbomonas tetramitiformis TaxID=36881 RepID=A0AAE0KTJ9_9CHLO|nr:hypothetical protein CYMTET_31027 [Cymbomonas tetramitiformis]
MEGVESDGEPEETGIEALYYDPDAGYEDFLDKLVEEDGEYCVEVTDVEELVQGELEEVCETTVEGSELTSPPASSFFETPPSAATQNPHSGKENSVIEPPPQLPTAVPTNLHNSFFDNEASQHVHFGANLPATRPPPSAAGVVPLEATDVAPDLPQEGLTPSLMSTLLDETPHTVHDPTIVQQDTLAHVCHVCQLPTPPGVQAVLTTCESCDLHHHHLCATQFRCPRCNPESSLPSDNKRPPAKLVAEVTALDNLTATQLVEQCKLRRVGVSGNKTLLKSRLIKAIAKVARTQPSHLATTDGVAHDTRPVGEAHGTGVPVTIQQVPHTGPELPPKTPRPSTSKKKKARRHLRVSLGFYHPTASSVLSMDSTRIRRA